jgi:predicted O-methyltransferase YrrM
MQELEARDAADREDGTDRLKRLRQIPPETGRFIALLAAMAPPGRFIEIGTSAGYSALWLALACRATARRLTTFEVLPEKVEIATRTFREAQVQDVVDLVADDFRRRISEVDDVAFCFLDAEKEVYLECYELIVPRMVPGGILVADNAINHAVALAPFLDRATSDPRVDAMVVPIAKGELVARKRPSSGPDT